ncbi:MAG: HDOD domain-containing protein [Gammaproteobacteria bacterium]|nr:HDOD domain-containing protein [Gammaproteobacteria bacterium]
MSTVWEQISSKAQLLSLPDVYLHLKKVLDDPDSSMIDVANVVSADAAMTTRLLRIVNSAYFGLATEIDTVNRAVNLLGTQEVHDLVLAVSVAQSFAGMSNQVMDMPRFWKRSVVCAAGAKELASLCNVLDGERLFVCGLLRDIGHLFIYQYAPDKAVQAMELAKAQNAPLFKAERAVLGVDYARVGAELMRQWKLPQTLWEPTEFHVDPIRADEFALSTGIVHLAAAVADAVDAEVDVDDALRSASPHAWQVTGIDPAQCVGVIDNIKGQVAAVTQMILPSNRAA